MEKIIECVPNFSEGRDMSVIKQITDAIKAVEDAKLLDVDPGKATNRTVVTFVGAPEVVVEAAFQAIRKASEVIDMRGHQGEHPRMGATDVCPLIPISGVTMEEAAECARQIGKRVGEELNIPIYLYEDAASTPERRNLATVRAGEYEGFADKIKQPEWKPDFGPAVFHPQAGQTAVGARDFLVAYNINLNTKSVRRANSVAFDLREKGRVKREGHPVIGEVVKDAHGDPVRIPGAFKGVKGIGWFIEEYGLAQVSLNITNIRQAPVHEVFEAARRSANSRGMRVTGSELVGLIPLEAMLDAGRYYLKQQNLSTGIAEREIVRVAAKSLGLDELSPFDPDQKIIEYRMRQGEDGGKLAKLDLGAFADETASESPAPGGGSIAAYAGALGAALGAMVANLSALKRGWEEQIPFFSDWADRGQRMKDRLVKLVDEDTEAFNRIIAAVRLPKSTDEEKQARKDAIDAATRYAIEVPFTVMEAASESMELLHEMAEKGNPNSASDAGVGALCARTAVMGAWINVKTNAADLPDDQWKRDKLEAAARLAERAKTREAEILAVVDLKIGGK